MMLASVRPPWLYRCPHCGTEDFGAWEVCQRCRDQWEFRAPGWLEALQSREDQTVEVCSRVVGDLSAGQFQAEGAV